MIYDTREQFRSGFLGPSLEEVNTSSPPLIFPWKKGRFPTSITRDWGGELKQATQSRTGDQVPTDGFGTLNTEVFQSGAPHFYPTFRTFSGFPAVLRILLQCPVRKGVRGSAVRKMGDYLQQFLLDPASEPPTTDKQTIHLSQEEMEKYPSKRFPRKVSSCITESRYQELLGVLQRDPSLSMSDLFRRIIQNQPVRLLVRSGDFSAAMEQLSDIRSQLEKIETRLNQLVDAFRGDTSAVQRFLLGKKMSEYQKELISEYRRIDDVLGKLQQRWLSE